MLTPKARYQQDLDQPHFHADPKQALAVEQLQRVFDQLLVQANAPRHRWSWPWRQSNHRRQSVRGLYLWGGVGRGKTYLMDVFFECLPFEEKMRLHFHRFMRRVHADLKYFAGQSDPLQLIADRIADESRILCFDEFFVEDITDAMLLGGLFTALFERQVTVIATSNVAPKNLYANGLQRSRFLPAIAKIEENMQIHHLDGDQDFRLAVYQKNALFLTPINRDTKQHMASFFDDLVSGKIVEDELLEIEGRMIQAFKLGESVAWFEFDSLCDGPRSSHDYIELARLFHTILISNVPQLNGRQEDQARRFISLVDEFYDRRVKVAISAAAPLENLYCGEHLKFEFQRTQSRLFEMQSETYLSSEHRP